MCCNNCTGTPRCRKMQTPCQMANITGKHKSVHRRDGQALHPRQHNQNMNVKEPLMPHDMPKKPWHTVGSDLFYKNTSPYLLVSDYYNKFPLVRNLDTIQSDTTIVHLKSIFEKQMAFQAKSSLAMTLILPLRCSKSSASHMALYTSQLVHTFHRPTVSSREQCKQ